MISIKVKRLLFMGACAALGAAMVAGRVSSAAESHASSNPYAGLNCEQIGAEYARLNRGLLTDAAPSTAGGIPEITRKLDYLKDVHERKACVVRLGASNASAAAVAADPSVGENEFRLNCAKCHGDDGKGNGWFVKYLKDRPQSLAQIKKNGGGVFPFDRVYQAVDGRQDIGVHGPRDMPVWGRIYYVAANKALETYVGELSPAEAVARAKIRALVNYISKLQE
jgi:mono/diheme cytochrome c family protein